MLLRMRIASWFAPLALLVLSSSLMSAQDAGSATGITGCLKQGSEKGGYYVTAQDGTMYELVGKSSNLAQHLNHTVTVTGRETKLPEAQESKLEPHEKTEASGGKYVDFQVADVKMVSASCQ